MKTPNNPHFELQNRVFAAIAAQATLAGFKPNRVAQDELMIQAPQPINLVATSSNFGIWDANGNLLGRMPYEDSECMSECHLEMWARFVINGVK